MRLKNKKTKKQKNKKFFTKRLTKNLSEERDDQ